jgi:hypothetical protein
MNTIAQPKFAIGDRFEMVRAPGDDPFCDEGKWGVVEKILTGADMIWQEISREDIDERGPFFYEVEYEDTSKDFCLPEVMMKPLSSEDAEKFSYPFQEDMDFDSDESCKKPGKKPSKKLGVKRKTIKRSTKSKSSHVNTPKRGVIGEYLMNLVRFAGML